jgi:hypothetical protein
VQLETPAGAWLLERVNRVLDDAIRPPGTPVQPKANTTGQRFVHTFEQNASTGASF